MSALELLLVAWALTAAGFSLVALWRLRRPACPTEPSAWPPVLLLRPLDAPSPDELAALGAPIDYPAPLEHLALAPHALALPAGVRWLPSDPVASNRKVGHLLYAAQVVAPAGRVVLAVDGDVRVDGALVRALVAPLAAGADLAWAPPRPEEVRTAWGRAVRGLLTRGHHAFDALAVMSAGAPAVCGKALGLGPRALALLPEVAECIGEDLELASRLSARGGRVVAAAAPARTLAERGRPSDTLARFTRWMQVLRAHRPALYPSIPLLFTPTLPLLAAAAGLGSLPLAGAVALLVAARLALSARLAARSGAGLGGAGYEWLLGEALLLLAFAQSLGRRTVEWRGRLFTLEGGGRMRAVFPPAARWGAT